MQHRRFPAVEALIGGLEGSSANTLNLLTLISAVVDLAMEQEIDPYAMLDVLEEAIVTTIVKLPTEKRMAAAVAAMRLILDGLRAHGVGQ